MVSGHYGAAAPSPVGAACDSHTPVGVGVLDDPVRRIVPLARCVEDAAPYGGGVSFCWHGASGTPHPTAGACRSAGAVRRGRRTLRRCGVSLRWHGASRTPHPTAGSFRDSHTPVGGVPRFAAPRRGRRPRRPGAAYRSAGTVRRGRRTLRWGRVVPLARCVEDAAPYGGGYAVAYAVRHPAFPDSGAQKTIDFSRKSG